jgi:hypothetical protein
VAGRKHHHVVSRGYQRFFAEGELLTLLDKKTGTVSTPVGTHDAFAKRNFNTRWIGGKADDELESEWARLEDIFLPLVRDLNEGVRDQGRRNAAKVLASIHVARSYWFRNALERIFDQVATEHVATAEDDQELLKWFRLSHGRDPRPGEIAERVSHVSSVERGSREIFIERMAHGHNRILDILEPLRVQLLIPASKSVGFVLGDAPVVHYTEGWGAKVGNNDELTLGDAAYFYMPLGRYLAMRLTREDEGDQIVPPWKVQDFNWLTWRASIRFIACHPADDMRRALATELI